MPPLCLVWFNIVIDLAIAYDLRSKRSFTRTIVGIDITFDMEPKLPKLQNLATHISECKGSKTQEGKDHGPTSEEQMNVKRSAEMMAAYLKEGELNPEVITTQKGFLRIFAAWILDESLPWTAGEAPTLQMLFKYLKISYQLPSDTTVRNQLACIFKELHGKVVREFTVRASSQKTYRSQFSFRASNQRSLMQLIRGPHHKWCILLHVRSDVLSMTTGKSLSESLISNHSRIKSIKVSMVGRHSQMVLLKLAGLIRYVLTYLTCHSHT